METLNNTQCYFWTTSSGSSFKSHVVKKMNTMINYVEQ